MATERKPVLFTDLIKVKTIEELKILSERMTDQITKLKEARERKYPIVIDQLECNLRILNEIIIKHDENNHNTCSNTTPTPR
jgi:hypothetical protein